MIAVIAVIDSDSSDSSDSLIAVIAIGYLVESCMAVEYMAVWLAARVSEFIN